MEKILALGASIIIRHRGSEGFNFMPSKYAVCVELHGIRNGLTGDDLEEIFARALPWLEDLQFYHGTQWTAEQACAMAARLN